MADDRTPSLRRGARRGLPVAVIGVLTVLTALGAAPAWAHGQLLQASPAPGQQVGGTLDFVDLAFQETAIDVDIAVTQGGAPVAGAMTVREGRIVRFAMAKPLTTAGRYDVTYTLTSGDADRYTEGYNFTYQPGSPQAFHLGNVDPAPAGGGGRARVIGSVVLVACLAGLAFLYLVQLERKRSAAAKDHPGG
jgi:methionine-rich copper-binding protein CopC